jgi:hypothetical protein
MPYHRSTRVQRRSNTEFTSVLYQKFAEKITDVPIVIPVKTGIQKSLKFLDSGSRQLSQACPE